MKKNGLFCKNCNLDERQLLQRGNVFKHTTIMLFALILINAMLKDYNITWAEGRCENMLIFWAGATLALCEYNLRDIAPAGQQQGILCIFLGVCGAALLVLGLIHAFGGTALLKNGMLTVVGAGMMQGLAMLVIFFTFLGRYFHERRQAKLGDED